MADMVELKAENRTNTGSAAAKKMRQAHNIPAIIYGGTKEPQKVSLRRKELWKQVESGQFLSTVYMLDIEGKKERVIPRDVQLDPVRDFLLHVDFLRIGKGARIDVAVPVQFKGEDESPGLKRGGALNIVRHDIELNCLAESIPDAIEIDVSEMDIGDSVHISSVTLPKDVEPTISDRDFTIATIVASSAMKGEDEDEEGSADAEETEETEETHEETAEDQTEADNSGS